MVRTYLSAAKGGLSLTVTLNRRSGRGYCGLAPWAGASDLTCHRSGTGHLRVRQKQTHTAKISVAKESVSVVEGESARSKRRKLASASGG